MHVRFQYLKEITNNFSNERVIGSGGSGVVYKGILQSGETVAVKKLVASPGSEKQYENEVYHFMKLEHPNIVRFKGYCYETQYICLEHNGRLVFAEKTERLLCLEYLPKGSLDRYLSDVSSRYDWQTRYKIIEGICYGLHYLQEQIDKPILHLDLKPANILLDDNMIPKITDFGLSRLLDQQQTIYTATRNGTFGYMAPEYVNGGTITTKSDIFSLGVIIMEVITGHRDYPDVTRSSFEEFIELELEKWRNELEKASFYTSLEMHCEQIKGCIQIGLICLNPERTKRPRIMQIIEMLEGLARMNCDVSNEETSSVNQIMSDPSELLVIRPRRTDREDSVRRTVYVSDIDEHVTEQKLAEVFSNCGQVITALREAGLESLNPILGIDFTKSNEWSGRHSFKRKSLHAINGTPNPYEQAISIIGRTLSPFDDDNLIPCFGFGDASTHDHSVFSFYQDNRPCRGFEEVLERYRQIVPHLKLQGPTSFAPLIHAAMSVVENSGWQYHVLVIIADGQVTTAISGDGRLSPQEQATIQAIVDASFYPLSIVMVGVGDGPWDAIHHFNDCIPDRAFDNFQFVNFTDIMLTSKGTSKEEAAFALAALMKIPTQYKATQGIRPPEKHAQKSASQMIRPPPNKVLEHDNAAASHPRTATSRSIDLGKNASDEQVCPICLMNPKDMAFQCGHLTCKECGPILSTCPLCRVPITVRVRLYS